VVEAIAEIKNMKVDVVAEQVIENFESFFSIKLG